MHGTWPGYTKPPLRVRPYPFPIAYPAEAPHYVVPGSHRLDPPYAFAPNCGPPWWVSQWPQPRQPWPWESETRAPGTGLIRGAPPCPCPPPPAPTGAAYASTFLAPGATSAQSASARDYAAAVRKRISDRAASQQPIPRLQPGVSAATRRIGLDNRAAGRDFGTSPAIVRRHPAAAV